MAMVFKDSETERETDEIRQARQTGDLRPGVFEAETTAPEQAGTEDWVETSTEAEMSAPSSGVSEPGRAQLAQHITGKPIVDINKGTKIGEASDLLFDPQEMRVKALTTVQGTLFNRERTVIPASEVTVWGRDVILVDRGSAAARGETINEEGLVKLSDQLKGRFIVSMDGSRIGQVEDVEIDSQGRLAGFKLSQVYIDGPLRETKHIPVQAVHTLGKDVLIIDRNKIPD